MLEPPVLADEPDAVPRGMPSDIDLGLSPALAAALERFSEFLRSDDDDRARAIEDSEPAVLPTLAAAVQPLFDEINAVLDKYVRRVLPLPPAQGQLESDLNSLAQAATEARAYLDDHPA